MNAILTPPRNIIAPDDIAKNNKVDMNASLDNLPFEPETDNVLCEMFSVLAGHVRDLGFDLCACHVLFPLPISHPRAVQIDNYPRDWNTRYRQQNYQAIDPTLAHARHYASSILWSEQVFAGAPALWSDMQAHGLNVGWGHPTRDARSVVGLLTVARAELPICPQEIMEKQVMLGWIAQTTHQKFSHHLAPRLMPEPAAPLSSREIDVLRWTADGKTAGEISAILAISERTVNYHASNAVLKLGVTNKTAAAAHAALLGML